MEEAAQQPPPKRSASGLALLAILAVGGSAVGVLYWQLGQTKDKPALDTSGFDIAQALDGPKASGSAAPSGPGMAMQTIATGMDGVKFGVQATGKAVSKAAANLELAFREHVKRSEAAVNNLALQYLAKYPVARQFAKDWMSKDDLKYMSTHYAYNHDPVFFLRHLAVSPNFGPIVKKYAAEPVVQTFAKDALKVVPANSMSAGMDYVSQQGAIKPVIENAMQSLGLPPGMFSGSAAGGPPKVDAGAMMSSMMGSNPELQKAMANPDAQKALSNPEAQKAMQQQQGTPSR